MPREMIASYVILKKAAAFANRAWARLDDGRLAALSQAIADRADECKDIVKIAFAAGSPGRATPVFTRAPRTASSSP